MKFKKVTKQEFEEFLNNNPNLSKTVINWCHPPIIQYIDLKNKWPDNIMASYSLGLDEEGYIKKDHNYCIHVRKSK